MIGGNVDVHQVWYDGHIESDTGILDPSRGPGRALDDHLHRRRARTAGEDDFSPFVMYFDNPSLDRRARMPLPHVGMDQTSSPWRTARARSSRSRWRPAKYYNLVYTWGWRMHPPRVQVMENATKTINYGGTRHPSARRSTRA